MKPRKITIEILTSDETNHDAIMALLEACRWLQLGYGNSVSENDTTEIAMHAKHGDSVAVESCPACGKYKPATVNGCFGCLSVVVRAGMNATPLGE